MACTLTRNDVSEIVLGVLREIHSDPSITEFSRFGIELLVDPFARATLYPGPISTRIRDRGCFLKVFGPTECQRAQDVEDIVTAAWSDVKSSQRVAVAAAFMASALTASHLVVSATALVPAAPAPASGTAAADPAALKALGPSKRRKNPGSRKKPGRP